MCDDDLTKHYTNLWIHVKAIASQTWDIFLRHSVGLVCKASILLKFPLLHYFTILRELHWLPVRRRLDFKLATLMFKSLHGCAPLYLSDACQSTKETSHRLRSSSTTTYVIPRTRTRLGDRAFDVAGPRLWNNLPASLRSTDSIAQFRKQLKTYLFRD